MLTFFVIIHGPWNIRNRILMSDLIWSVLIRVIICRSNSCFNDLTAFVYASSSSYTNTVLIATMQNACIFPTIRLWIYQNAISCLILWHEYFHSRIIFLCFCDTLTQYEPYGLSTLRYHFVFTYIRICTCEHLL